MLYIAHKVFLGKEGRPLVNQDFYAELCGPVMPMLFFKLSSYGKNPIENIFSGYSNLNPSLERDALDEAYRSIYHLSDDEAVKLCRKPDGAYIITLDLKKALPIHNCDIEAEYHLSQ